MNALCINTNRGSYLAYYWEEIKRQFKNFLEIYHEMLTGESKPGPAESISKTSEQPEELPKYLWI